MGLDTVCAFTHAVYHPCCWKAGHVSPFHMIGYIGLHLIAKCVSGFPPYFRAVRAHILLVLNANDSPHFLCTVISVCFDPPFMLIINLI